MGSGRGEGSHLPTRELSLPCLALSGFWGGLVGSWSCSSQVGGVGGLLGAAQTPQVFLSLFGWLPSPLPWAVHSGLRLVAVSSSQVIFLESNNQQESASLKAVVIQQE